MDAERFVHTYGGMLFLNERLMPLGDGEKLALGWKAKYRPGLERVLSRLLHRNRATLAG